MSRSRTPPPQQPDASLSNLVYEGGKHQTYDNYHLNGHPIIARAYRRGVLRWQGYVGDDRPGISYKLCPHHHRTPWTAQRCATSLASTFPRRRI